MSQSNNPYDSPQAPQYQPPPHGHGHGDATGGIIPYKNVPALLAYYLGLFSLFPCVGFVLGLAAFVLGIMGLMKRAKNPEVKGSVHAWIGIVMGGIMAVIWGLVDLGVIIAIIADQ